MLAYAPTDVASVNVGDGCGREHTVEQDPRGGRGIECATCSTALLALPSLGWAGTPHGVKLTVDENASLEEAKATGLSAQSLAAKAIGEKIAELVMTDKKPAKVEVASEDVLTALADLPQEKLAALLRMAGLAPDDAIEDEKPVARRTRTKTA